MLNHMQDTLDMLNAKHPGAGICLLGDLNRLDISKLCRHNSLVQVVTKPTRGNAILDKIVTNIAGYYNTPDIGSPIGLSDHSTVIWLPNRNHWIVNRCRIGMVETTD